MDENKNRRPERNLLGATTQEECQTKGYDLALNDNWVLRSTVLVTFVLLAVQWIAFVVVAEVLA